MTIGVSEAGFKSCMLKNADELRLLELIAHNLNSFENIIDYNIKNNIKLFRISSDLIPFGSSYVNTLPWWDIFADQFLIIGDKIQKSAMRVSMHPGQYTVLNSPDANVVTRAIEDLNYHAQLLDSLDTALESKIVLHIGGVYQNKKEAMQRFIINYSYLNDAVKQRLVIENDDKSYNIEDVLDIGKKLGIPVIFDNLHHIINPSSKMESFNFWINECKKTWKKADGTQKIHYSQQDPLKRAGSHSPTIRIREFMDFYNNIEGENLDIMLEVKDKNLSAVKCINCIADKKINTLEVEWSKYKYTILEKSPENYLEIRKLLNYKEEYPAVEFYELIEESLHTESTLGNSINAVQHVWGYFKKTASEKEKIKLLEMIRKYEQEVISIRPLKNFLKKMATKYEQAYLLDSYYFIL